MVDYKEKLDERFKNFVHMREEHGAKKESVSKLEFIGSDIFDFTTYDSEMDEILAVKMLGVCNAILNNTIFEYIKNKENYINYITMVNMQFLIDKIAWGTSIRGAHFDDYSSDPFIYVKYIIGNEYKDLFPRQDLKIFMKDLIEWSEYEKI